MDKSHNDRQPLKFITVIYLNAQGEVNNWDVPLDGVALYYFNGVAHFQDFRGKNIQVSRDLKMGRLLGRCVNRK